MTIIIDVLYCLNTIFGNFPKLEMGEGMCHKLFGFYMKRLHFNLHHLQQGCIYQVLLT